MSATKHIQGGKAMNKFYEQPDPKDNGRMTFAEGLQYYGSWAIAAVIVWLIIEAVYWWVNH